MIDTSNPRIRRLVEQVHALGPAPLVYALADIDRGASVTLTLERYASLPADFIRAAGGDRFPPRLHAIDGGRAA